MLSKYRATAAELNLPASRMQAVQGNLLVDPAEVTTHPALPDAELQGFDLVAICMALHHVDDISVAAQRLAARLRPGGVLLIIDWATPAAAVQHGHGHGHQPHPAAHTISHDSFTEGQILGLFELAGCRDPSFVLADKLSVVPGARSGTMQMFFARAIKM